MTNRTAASRYARALLDVAIAERADLSRLEQDLAGFVDLIAAHPELGKVLVNPAVPTPNKRGAVEALLARVDITGPLGKLLVMLADRDRLVLLPDLLNALRERLMAYRNIVSAEVTTVEPLPAERTAAFEQSLARATGQTVQLSARVDPAIVGGIVARVGSTVYDASITTQLKRLQQRLEESV